LEFQFFFFFFTYWDIGFVIGFFIGFLIYFLIDFLIDFFFFFTLNIKASLMMRASLFTVFNVQPNNNRTGNSSYLFGQVFYGIEYNFAKCRQSDKRKEKKNSF